VDSVRREDLDGDIHSLWMKQRAACAEEFAGRDGRIRCHVRALYVNASAAAARRVVEPLDGDPSTTVNPPAHTVLAPQGQNTADIG
jgi:hypothetical protein